MKRFALLFASFVLSTVMIGCGEEGTPPAGKIGTETGTDTGPPTKGEAKKDREKLFKDMSEGTPRPVTKKGK